jgi:uncharacterized membrane protein
VIPDPWTLAAIVAMAVVTYACRGGGYVVFRHFAPGPRLRAVLDALPGSLFVAYVVPALASGRVPQWAGAVVTVGVMVATRSLVASIALGTAVAWIVWSL